MQVQAIFPVALSVRDAVVYTGLSRASLYRLMQSRELSTVKVAGRRMIRRDVLDALFGGPSISMTAVKASASASSAPTPSPSPASASASA